jgi:hypothetical protein
LSFSPVKRLAELSFKTLRTYPSSLTSDKQHSYSAAEAFSVTTEQREPSTEDKPKADDKSNQRDKYPNYKFRRRSIFSLRSCVRMGLTAQIKTLPYHLQYHITFLHQMAQNQTLRGDFHHHLNCALHFFPNNPTLYPSVIMSLRKLEKNYYHFK